MIPDPCSLSADRVLAQRLLLAHVRPSVGQLDLLRPELSFKDPWEIIAFSRDIVAPFRARGGSAAVSSANLRPQRRDFRPSMAATSPAGTAGENR
jgi:hypothetical protein